uniref:phenylalanyl-tRNA synthetase subunit beta n=1 Tax=Polyopes affinis TaxID=194519 RepID=UPI002A7F5CD6|nr:phenylalanyl-tRNA synthetase subunit beta [Polyopes affinis]WOL37014.1 phenylalanyl-tRNA synthetase subunit beta [Polyopes affinis]
MKVSWKWISQLADLNEIKLNELIEKLTLAGFEIEEVYELPEIKDTIIDLKLTANRQDASFLIGLAREINTILKKPLKYYIDNVQDNVINNISNNSNILYESLYDIKIDIITNIQNRTSPKWLQDYLKSYNIQRKDILNDIIEYNRIKWGQDIEIFDAKKIDIQPTSSKNLIIDSVGNINQILSHDSKQKSITPALLKYKNTILSIIGIKSNENLKCDFSTSSILVCSTICKPEYIKLISKKLNIKTDKINKHIKQILRCDFFNAYQETILLISTFTRGTIGKSYEYHRLYDIQKSITVKKNIIYSILGPINNKSKKFLSVHEILSILNQLNFQSKYNNIKQTFEVLVPKYRSYDIKRAIDVIEEIGRIYGFEKFNDTLPKIIAKGQTSNQTKTIKKIRKTLRDFGIHEIIHYSLNKQSKNKIDNINNLSLFNPLTKDQAILQGNLITNLVATQKYNINQKNFNIEGFEIGRVFIQNEHSLNHKKEEIYLSGIMGRSNFSKQSWSETPKKLGWFQAKGLLEDFFEKLEAVVKWRHIKDSETSIITKQLTKLLNQKRTSIIYNPKTNKEIGLFGQLNLKSNYNEKNNYATYIFEIRLVDLINTIQDISHVNYKIKVYSIYPSVTRDMSVTLSNNEQIEVICKKILDQNNSLIESIKIFNEYKHQNKKNSRKVGLRITYRAKDRTLNDVDLMKIDKEIGSLLKTNI